MDSFEMIMQKALKDNAHMRNNHIEMVSVERDYAIFKMEINIDNMNPFGMVHGGALYTLADNATGAAAVSIGQPYVTQEGSLHFVDNQTSGIVKAEARVCHRGRKTCLIEVDITGENGKLIATGLFTYFRIEMP